MRSVRPLVGRSRRRLRCLNCLVHRGHSASCLPPVKQVTGARRLCCLRTRLERCVLLLQPRRSRSQALHVLCRRCGLRLRLLRIGVRQPHALLHSSQCEFCSCSLALGGLHALRGFRRSPVSPLCRLSRNTSLALCGRRSAGRCYPQPLRLRLPFTQHPLCLRQLARCSCRLFPGLLQLRFQLLQLCCERACGGSCVLQLCPSSPPHFQFAQSPPCALLGLASCVVGSLLLTSRLAGCGLRALQVCPGLREHRGHLRKLLLLAGRGFS